MMEKYKLLSKQGEGTFSEVVKVQHKVSGNFSAIKCMKAKYDTLDDVNNLREIQALRRLSPHPNIIVLQEVLYDQPTGRLALVFEFMDINILELIQDRRQRMAESLVKILIFQLFSALKHMHSKGIFHRDIKPENILIDKTRNTVKLADLGSCRGIYQKPPFTEYISTRWYRAPECLLTDGCYGPEMDIWGAGCVLFEIITLYPLFPGSDEVDQINRIHKILGTPNRKIFESLKKKCPGGRNYDFPVRIGSGIGSLIPFVAKEGLNFLTMALMYEMKKRITAQESLSHPYFGDINKFSDEENLPSILGKTESQTISVTNRRKPIQNDNTSKSGLPSINHKSTSKVARKPSSLMKKTSSFKQNTIDENLTSVRQRQPRKPIHERIRNSIQLPSIYKTSTKDSNKTERRRKKEKLTDTDGASLATTGRRRRINKQYQNVQSSGYGFGKPNRIRRNPPATLSPLHKLNAYKSSEQKSKARTTGQQPLTKRRSHNKIRDNRHPSNNGIT